MEHYHNNTEHTLPNRIQNRVLIGINSKILYDGKSAQGRILHEDIEKGIKIITLQIGEKEKECVVAKETYMRGSDFGGLSGIEGVRFVDLKQGTELFRYEYFRGFDEQTKKKIKPISYVKDDYELIKEEDFIDLLIQSECIHSDYSVGDLLEIYSNNTTHTRNKEKELMKKI